MGVGTNQIATNENLYWSGYTSFPTGVSGVIGVTTEDIMSQYDKNLTKVSSKPYQQDHYTISPTYQMSNSSSAVLNVSSGSAKYEVSVWGDMGIMSCCDEIVLMSPDGPVDVTVQNLDGSAKTAYLYLTLNDQEPTTLGSSTSNCFCVQTGALNALTGASVRLTSCVCNALENGQKRTSKLKGKTSMKWVVYIKSSTSGRVGISSSNAPSAVSMKFYSPDKCVRYLNYGGSANSVKQPWHVKISESVSGETRANKITFYYAYVSWADSAHSAVTALTHIKIGEWNYGSNVDGSAEADITIETNPFYIMRDADHSNMAGSYLYVECGTTNKKQNFYYKLRSKNTADATQGTWDTSYTLTQSNTDKTDGGWDPNSLNAIKVPVSGESAGDKYFLQAVRDYNGIEFYIDNK